MNDPRMSSRGPFSVRKSSHSTWATSELAPIAISRATADMSALLFESFTLIGLKKRKASRKPSFPENVCSKYGECPQ
ncbi:hypothetical protein QYM36_005601 [Artemia franciscana]|uniref:Uncharacterized protein n=1 Tax=Artemia franciscana TaxID=6661 RepID=A0AA88HWD7_ARTSF|nr:hypothetical protein QYM36_005601 [Artemia franciscana]